jgi:hypothetical protein
MNTPIPADFNKNTQQDKESRVDTLARHSVALSTQEAEGRRYKFEASLDYRVSLRSAWYVCVCVCVCVCVYIYIYIYIYIYMGWWVINPTLKKKKNREREKE